MQDDQLFYYLKETNCEGINNQKRECITKEKFKERIMSNRLTRFIACLSYIIIVGFLIYKLDVLGRYLKDLYSRTYEMSYLWTYLSLSPIVIGILLALPHIVGIITKPGYLKFDGIKFLIVGIPTFCMAMIPIYIMSGLEWPISILKLSGNLMAFHYHNLIVVSGIVFGYVLVTSFYRKSY